MKASASPVCSLAISAVLLMISSLAGNADPAASSSSSFFDDDRLSRKITYEAKAKSVRLIIADLAKSTGVTLHAGYNNRDWQVRDRKMNILAKDVPLSDVMQSIARVMKFKWSRGTNDDSPSYRVFMDRRALLDAEAARQREEERFAEEQFTRRGKALDSAIETRFDALDADQKAALRSENPLIYELGITGMADVYGIFRDGMPGQADTMLRGGETLFDASSLPAEGQRKLAAMLDRILKTSPDAQLAAGAVSAETIRSDMGRLKLHIRPNDDLSECEGHQFLMSFLGTISLDWDSKLLNGVMLFDPDTQYARWWPDMRLRGIEGTVGPNDQLASPGAAEEASCESARKRPRGEETVEHPDSPELHIKAKLKPKSKTPTLDEVQRRLAEGFGLCVVSDSFGGYPPRTDLWKGEQELGEALTQVASGFRYNWWKRGGTLEFRDKQWYRKRAAQIPDEWVEKWRSAFVKNGFLDLDELSQIAMLSSEQRRVNLDSDDVLGGVNLGHDAFLQTYALLSPEQRAILFTDEGVDICSLTPEQQKPLAWRYSRYLEDSGVDLRLRGTRSALAKRFRYDFAVVAPDPTTWAIETPIYRPPQAKAEPEADER